MTQLESGPRPETVDPIAESITPGRPRPHSDAAVAAGAPSAGHGHLQETPAGWVLTLSLDVRAAARFDAGAAGAARFDLGGIEMTVSPNLVPGGPFAVDLVEVVIVDNDAKSA